MCGRYTLASEANKLQQAFPGFTFPDQRPPRFNIAPSQPVAVVPNLGQNRVELFRWGLIPFWAKDATIGNRMINARAETLAEKPSFRTPYKRQRCLILADGFYEWRKDPGHKQKIPIYIRLKSGAPFAFAGLWDVWRGPDEGEIYSCTIITTTANELVETIHHRMPVILAPEAYPVWLEPSEQSPALLKRWLKAYPAEAMEAFPVSLLVNNPHNDSPACIETVA